jgi:PUA domain protein
MFKKFTVADSVSSQTQMKSSAVRKVKASILESYPQLEADVEVMFPKKAAVMSCKSDGRVEIAVTGGRPLFFSIDGAQPLPTLPTLHRWPDLLPRMQVDKGAIKFVMKGSNIMCPGFTSAGGSVGDVDLDVGAYVAVYAEGMEHALAVGQLKMSTKDIVSLNKDIGVENIHYVGDGLWAEDCKFADKQ